MSRQRNTRQHDSGSQNDAGRPADARQAETHDQVAPGATDTERRSFGHLSRRIVRWSSNLVATAVILILGLSLGRQVLTWWHGDQQSLTSPTDMDAGPMLDPFMAPGRPMQLFFGDTPYVFDRQVVEGSESAALAELRRRCRAVAEDYDPQRYQPLPASTELLAQIRAGQPVEQGDGWRIVQNRGPVITVVAMRDEPVNAAEPPETAGQNMGTVVSWGLGLRSVSAANNSSPDRWTLYVCSGKGQLANAGPKVNFQLPDGAERSFAVQVSNGGMLMGFRSSSPCSATRQFLDASLEARSWTRKTKWTLVADSWHVRYQNPAGGICDIQLFEVDSNNTNGILTVSGPLQNAEK